MRESAKESFGNRENITVAPQKATAGLQETGERMPGSTLPAARTPCVGPGPPVKAVAARMPQGDRARSYPASHRERGSIRSMESR